MSSSVVWFDLIVLDDASRLLTDEVTSFHQQVE